MTHEAESATIWRALVKEFDKAQHAQKERDRRNGLVFSLDDERLRDYLESRCMAYDVDPCRIFIRMESYRILYDALNTCWISRLSAFIGTFSARKTIPRLPEAKA